MTILHRMAAMPALAIACALGMADPLPPRAHAKEVPDIPKLEAGAGLVASCTSLALPQQAERACRAAIDSGLWQGAKLAWAWNNLGLARAAQGDMLRAVSAYSRALRLDPNYAPALSNRGNAHAALGDMLPALDDHTKATEIDPTYTAAWHNRAVDLEELGRYREALDGYRKVLKLDPAHPGAHVGLATSSCKLGRIKSSAQARISAVAKGHIDPKRMQALLQARGFYKGAIDGIFGKGSRAAVWAWTRKGCLPPA